jgi:hypothetical protein
MHKSILERQSMQNVWLSVPMLLLVDMFENHHLDNSRRITTHPEMIFTLQSDGVKHKTTASTININGQVGSRSQRCGIWCWWFGGALRIRKQLVEKFDGTVTTDVRERPITAGSRPIDIAEPTNAGQGYILHKFSNKKQVQVLKV